MPGVGSLEKSRSKTTNAEVDKIQDQAGVKTELRQRHTTRSRLLEDVLGLALEDEQSEASSSSSIYSSSEEKMGPRPNEEESASFLPTTAESGSRVRKTTVGCLSRVTRQRNKWMALSVVIFVTFQIWAWGPELKGKDRDWRQTLDCKFNSHQSRL
jgi:transglutaminase/protease-like cytokinesis protein 3